MVRRTSRASRAGLTLSVSRSARALRQHGRVARIGKAAPVYLAAAVEYLMAEVLELAGYVTRDNKRKRINPRDLMLAMRADREFEPLVADTKVTMAFGGVVPKEKK